MGVHTSKPGHRAVLSDANSLAGKRKEHIELVLRGTGFDLDRTAELLHITPASLRMWIRKLDISLRSGCPRFRHTQLPPAKEAKGVKNDESRSNA